MYLFNVAYGTGKAGVDKMAHDCGQELKKKGVTMVALWPGPVQTEKIQEQVLGKKNSLSNNTNIQHNACPHLI